jgi:tripartite-type tricarboxylate transporter receptor subunit TctC
MSGELFKIMAGLDMVTVHYRGDTPALTDLLGGQVHVYFSSFPAVVEFVKAGKLRALAVTSTTRSDALPDVPTVAEFVSGYEVNATFGLGAPRATPTEIIDRLNTAINAVIAEPKTKVRLAELGCTVFSLSPAEYRQLIVDETDKWAEVIKSLGLKAD